MAQVTYKSLCACGNEAVISKNINGHTVHKCFECLRKPQPQTTRLRERDNKMLRQLGLIA